MYSSEEKSLILNRIDILKNSAAEKAAQEVKPKLPKVKAMIKILEDYVQKKDRIIYGGSALNMLLKHRGRPGIYNNDKPKLLEDIHDIDFYSPKPKNDIIELCNIYQNMKFEFVEGMEAEHEGTYTVAIDSVRVCDISYVPPQLYSALPTIKVGKFSCIHPEFMKIDYYRVFNDPLGSWWRLEKMFEKYYRLQEAFPFECDVTYQPSNRRSILESDPKNVVFNYLADKDSLLLFGYYAYRHYLHIAGRKSDIQIPYYEAISINYRADSAKLFEKLKSQYGNEIRMEERYPFFQFLDFSYCIYRGDNILIAIYGNNFKCIPFRREKLIYFGKNQTEIRKSKINLTSFHYNIMTLLVKKFRMLSQNRTDKLEKYSKMICNLLDAKQSYLRNNNRNILDDTIYKDFIIECRGMSKNPKLEIKEKIKKRKERKACPKWAYRPADKKQDPYKEHFVYSRQSGEAKPLQKERLTDSEDIICPDSATNSNSIEETFLDEK